MKKAFITGIPGQDGSYLTEFLIEKGYDIYGLIESDKIDLSFIKKHIEKLHLYTGLITNQDLMEELIKDIQPDEFYHLAAQSSPRISFISPNETYMTNILGTSIILEALKRFSPNTRTFLAISAEIYGNDPPVPQNENTRLNPTSPYGISKTTCFFLGNLYRNDYNLYVSNGILYNHESERRSLDFVSRKITNTVAKIKFNLVDHLELGNINIKRDWGYAKDYVKAMWHTLQPNKSDNYVICSNELHSVKEMVEIAFNEIGINLSWYNSNKDEIAKCNDKLYVKINPEFYRENDISRLIGDNSKIKGIGWKPEKNFEELIRLMVENDLQIVEKSLNAH